MAISAGVTLRLLAGWSSPVAPERAEPTTSTSRSSAAAAAPASTRAFSCTFSRTFAAASGCLFSMRLKSSNTRAPPFDTNSGLISSRSLRESSLTCGMRMAITGRSLLMASPSRSEGAKQSATSVKAGGDEIIARAFGRGARHERCFDLEEALRSEVVADGKGHFVPQFDVELHGVAAQVDVAIFQAHFFVREHRVRRQKGERLRHIQNSQLFHHQFDFTGWDIGIDGVGI